MRTGRQGIGCLKRKAPQPFEKIEKIHLILADIDITKIQLPVVFFKLEEYLVKFIQLLCRSIWLDR